jgi:hypothetical protein
LPRKQSAKSGEQFTPELPSSTGTSVATNIDAHVRAASFPNIGTLIPSRRSHAVTQPQSSGDGRRPYLKLRRSIPLAAIGVLLCATATRELSIHVRAK